MTEDRGAAAARPPPVRRTGQVAAAVLLVGAAVFAVAGPFGTFVAFRYPPDPGGPAVAQLLTGWRFELVGLPVPLDRVDLYLGSAPMTGLPLVAGAVLAMAGAVLLLLRPAAGRAFAAFAGGLLAGCVAAVWLDLLALVGGAGPGAVQGAAALGPGAWLVLGAGVAGLAAAALAVTVRPAADQPYVPHPGTPSLLAGVVLSVAAVLAVAGSLGALVVRRATDPPTTVSTSGWTQTVMTGAPDNAVTSSFGPPLLGVPLVAGAAVAVAAAVLLVLSTRNPRDPVRTRLLGVCAGGVIVGAVVPIWLGLAAAMRNADMLAERGVEQTVAPGAGAWLVLPAGIAGLLAVVLLLVPARRPDPAAHTPPWAAPPTP